MRGKWRIPETVATPVVARPSVVPGLAGCSEMVDELGINRRAGVMGGAGSGNYYHWWRSGKKTVVEDCLSLDANRWTREGILRAGVLASGSWQWTYSNGQGFIVSYQ